MPICRGAPARVMRATLQREAAEVYSSYMSAFTYTLAVTTVENIVRSQSRSLLVLALTMIVTVGLLSLARVGIQAFAATIGTDPTSKLLAGPTGLALFLVTTGRGVAVHFMSTIVGRWVLQLADGADTAVATTLAPTITLGVGLLWLLGRAVGIA